MSTAPPRKSKTRGKRVGKPATTTKAKTKEETDRTSGIEDEDTDDLVERLHATGYRVATGIARVYSTFGATLDLKGVDEEEVTALQATAQAAQDLAEGLWELASRTGGTTGPKSRRGRGGS